MIFKVFVMVGGLLVGTGYVCINQFYRPIAGLVIGTVGVVMLLFWGISDDDLRGS
jgi:hypothetical protein